MDDPLDVLHGVPTPFADRDEGTVYEHLKRALDFSMQHMGPHGMPAGLHADWNDCLRLGADGESSFVAFQFYYAFTVLREFAEYRGDAAYLDWLTQPEVLVDLQRLPLLRDGGRYSDAAQVRTHSQDALHTAHHDGGS